jgi:hypothetical protein
MKLILMNIYFESPVKWNLIPAFLLAKATTWVNNQHIVVPKKRVALSISAISVDSGGPPKMQD